MDRNDDNVETIALPTSKKAKKEKRHKAVKWKKKRLSPKPTFKPDQDKRTQALLLKRPGNIGLTVWSSFKKVFLDIAFLSVEEANRYANSDKNKLEINVTLNGMLNFFDIVFLYEQNISLSEKDYWSIDPDLHCDVFPEAMTQNRFFELKSFFHASNNQSLNDS